ncbi:MAG: hypothetical protein EXR57_01060 [Dehalococcoidia bacterium]|nr:hypothetical protein [Dehalococcoidia bacterium]MSQ34394.1 hypothetical protein [Dehalococcoidia bacterium]
MTRFPLRALTVVFALALLATVAGCSSGTPAPTPDPLFNNKWEFAGYQVDVDRLTVFARVFGASKVSALLGEDILPNKTSGSEKAAGLREFIFEKPVPGRYNLNLSDDSGNAYIQYVWVPAATVSDLAASEKITLKPGEGFRVKSADSVVLFTGVLGESRCPVGVTCVRAGQVDLMMTAFKKGVPAVETMFHVANGVSSDELVTTFTVTVHSVSPEPRSGEKPDFSQYEIVVSAAGG